MFRFNRDKNALLGARQMNLNRASTYWSFASFYHLSQAETHRTRNTQYGQRWPQHEW